MSSAPDPWTHLWSILSRRKLRAKVDEELDFHLDMLTRRFESQGMDPEAAREAAEARFGDPRKIRKKTFRAERSRIQQHKRELYMDNLRRDLRFAFRQLWKRPVFSVIALAMLALGIGANTAIFSVVYGVLLKPLPFFEPDRIVSVWESRVEEGWERASVAPGNFWDFREMNRAFEDLGAYRFTSVNLTGQDLPEQLRAGRVTAGFFGEILGVRPVLGRAFLPEEDDPGAESRVALLGNAFWYGHFGGSREVLGTSITLDGQSTTIVGVLPAGRPWLDNADVYLPLVRNPNDIRSSFELSVLGRLRPGMTLEQGRNDLAAVARRLEEEYPEELAGIGIAVGPSSEWVATPETRQALWLLLGAVGFLLMIACVNLANLFLARATGRVRETAIRKAAGASRGRLIRQGLTESLVVSLLGSALGLGVAVGGLRSLVALAPSQIPGLAAVSINVWVLAFTLGAGVVTGLITGLVPSFQASGREAAQILRAGGQSIAGNRTHQRVRGALVATEVALSLVLLVGAGLLIRSFGELLAADRGFETDHRLVASVNLPASYGPAEMQVFNREFLTRVSALPGVVNAAAVHIRPLAGGSTGLGFARPDDPAPEGGTPWASWRLVTPGYFATLGVPILRGRDFTEDDFRPMEDGSLPVLVSDRVVRQLWPDEDPLGKTITLWAGQSETPGTILGVVGDMRERGIQAGPTFAVYLPYLAGGWPPDVVIHTTGEPTAVVPAVRSILAELDPNVPLSNVTSMEATVGQSLGGQRFIMLLVSVFAGLALLLAMAGVYGVQSYSVAQQTSEIGVRVAMGASNGRILRRVLLQAMRPASLGLAAGLAGAVLLSRFMASLLFEVDVVDPATYAAVASGLLATALLSAWLPARRAAKVDPIIAFRTE